MIQNLAKHKLILIVVAIVIAGVAWWGLSASNAAPAPALVTTPSSTNAADQDLVATLLQLRAVKLDGGILSDPEFLSLKDFSTEIVPEPVGRANPFAPLSSQVSPSATTTSSAQIFTPRP